MPIDTRFLNAAKDKAKAVKRAGLQFARENPHVGPASNRVAEAWRSKKAKKAVQYEDIHAATQSYSKQSLPLNVYQDVMRRYYSGRMGQQPNLTAESTALTSQLERVLDKEEGLNGSLQYLSNALHAEKLRTLGAKDLLSYKDYLNQKVPVETLRKFPSNIKLSPIAPILTREEIKAAVHTQLGNEAFIRGMNSRIQRMDGLIFLDGTATASDKLLARYSSAKWGSGLIEKQMQAENPALFHSLSDLVNKSWFNSNDLSVLSLEEEGHSIAALRYKDLTIPVVQSDGSVRLGDSFRRVGISRKVYTSDKLMQADVYAVEALKRGQDLGDISGELQRVNISGAIDSAEDFSTLVAPAYGEYVNADGGFALRSRSAVPSHLFGFQQINESGNTEVVGFNALNAESKEASVLQAVSKHGFTKVGSESGVSKGVFEMLETEQLAAFGLPNREKQNPAWRSYTKNIRLTKTPEFMPGSMTKVRDSLHPFFETDYMSKIAPAVDRREIGIRVAGISGGEKTLFGDLPETVEGLAGYEDNAVSLIAKEHSISTIEARKAWMSMSHWLSDPNNLKAMRKLGTLGEGGFLMRKNLYGMGVERTVRYNVHELHVPDWQSMIGTPIEEALGLEKGQKAVLGYHNGNPVTASGSQNFIENVHEMGDGTLGMEVREVVPFGTGTKIDAGIKGLVSGVNDAEMHRIKSGLNRYYESLGTGGVVGKEVEALQVLHYGQNKEEPLEALLNATGDTFRRLEESGEIEHVAPYISKLEQQGLKYEHGTLTFETSVLKSDKGEELRNASLDIIQNMFNDVSDRIERGRITGDEFMRHFATSKEDSYLQFVHRYADPRTMRVWNTTKWNTPQEVKVTYDMLQQLATKGYHGAAADILDRLKYDGDPRMTAQVEQYLSGQHGAITNAHDLNTLTGGKAMRRMSDAEGRADTLFDPSAVAAEENYLLKLPDGSQVPVLGHNAYGGKVNRYGTAQFSPSEHEKALMNLARVYEDKTPDMRKVETARETYLNSLKQFVYGKNSYLRADAVDSHMALGQFVQTRASTLRYEDGSVNPFQIGIGRDMANKIMDEGTRKSLIAGEDVFAAVTRHPVSDMPFVHVKIDERLNGTNIIGLDEGMRGLLMADDDQDMIWSFFMKKGSKGYEEAEAAVTGKDPLQLKALKFQQALEGVADDPRSYFAGEENAVSDLKIKDLFGQLKNRAGGWAAPVSLDKALTARSTSGSIGAFSNTLTQMLIGLENNGGVTDLSKKREMMRYFFTTIRQGPISASKLKSGQDMDLSRALGINAKLQRNLDQRGSFDEFYSAMGELSDAADAASKRDTFRNYLAENRDVLKSYYEGFDRESVAKARDMLSRSAASAPRVKELGMDENLLSYIRAAATEEQPVASVGAQMSAESLGLWNRAQTVAREVGEGAHAFKPSFIIGAGIAIAAAAGLASGSFFRGVTPTFGRSSGNRYRPEESAGVSDVAPGGAMEGSRASRPPRSLIPTPSQTRTAIVAPLHETADLDVRMRATDRARATDTARLMSRVVTDGDSNITINYQGSKRKSLREKERMRGMLQS